MKLTALFSAIAAIVTSHRRADTTESLTPKQLRALLEEEGYAWTDEDWKTKGRACVRGEAERLFNLSSPVKASSAGPEQSPVRRKRVSEPAPFSGEPPKKASKYERMATTNLNTFMSMVGGDDGAGDDESAEGVDTDDASLVLEDEDAGSASEAAAEVSDSSDETRSATLLPVRAGSSATKRIAHGADGAPLVFTANDEASDGSHQPKAKQEKNPRKSKGKGKADPGQFKSNETVDDSDDDGEGGSASGSASVEAKDQPAKKKLRKSADPKEKKPRVKKEPAAKPGDQPKGTAEQEMRISKLKELCVAAGTARPFNASTGAERSLTVATRTSLLERLLNDVGLQCTGTSLPSMSKAKKIGKDRELEKEMREISGAPIVEGLRDGKKVRPAVVESDEVEADAAPKPPKKKFGAFLGGLQSDSD